MENPATPLSGPADWLYEAFGGTPTDAGIAVSPKSSLKFSAVYSCVNILSQSIAQVPWDVYKRTGDRQRDVARNRAEHYLLHSEPNGKQTSYFFRVCLMASALLHGNGYAELVRDGATRVKSIRFLPSMAVTVCEHPSEDRLVYRITECDGSQRDVDGSDIIHIPCLSLDGCAGMSPIQQHRQGIALALAAEKMGSAFFGNGSRPSGLLYAEGPLKEEQRKQIAEAWQKAYGSAGNTGKTPLLSGGVKWQQLTIPPDDAQFLQTREFQVQEIARIFRVPTILLGVHDKASTYASAEQFFLSFVKFTLVPWAQSIEQEFNRKLFPNDETLYCKLDLNGLMRGDSTARAAFYKAMFDTASISSNDIRELEDLNPIEGGDRYFVQQNLMPVDMVDEVLKAKAQQPTLPPAADPQTKSVHVRWLESVVARMRSWKSIEKPKAVAAFDPIFRSWAADSKIDIDAFCRSLAEEAFDEQFVTRAVARFEEACHAKA
jgi:HK97 family phage portal protein